jgi:hypothetical protein
MDPAGVNPVPNAVVYVPDGVAALPDLSAVPLSCGCSQLYPTSVLAHSAPTDATGRFSIPCAPSGTVDLVVQLGKWRMLYPGNAVPANQATVVPALHLPRNSTDGSLPDIAISTGGADSLECLPLRMGVAASEYVLGSATGGHLHIYTGDGGAGMAAGSVAPYQALWDQQSDLNAHDLVLLSCEGHETTNATPSLPLSATTQSFLLDYANAGGRVFASHFHYAWFNTGPFAVGGQAPAVWITGAQQINDATSFPAQVTISLPDGGVFAQGAALHQWLGLVGALTNDQLPIWFVRHNVSALFQPPSVDWIHLASSVTQAPSATQYFSFDMPVGASPQAACGRIAYSDLHVGGGPGVAIQGVPADYPNPGASTNVVPTGCAIHPLTPQEAALEFMILDLSSCLVPVGQ